MMMRQRRRNCEVRMLYLQYLERLDVTCRKRASGERAWSAANSGRQRLSQRRVDSTTCAAAAAAAPPVAGAASRPPALRSTAPAAARVAGSDAGPGSRASAAWPPGGGGDDVHVQEGAVVEPGARVAEGELPRVDPSEAAVLLVVVAHPAQVRVADGEAVVHKTLVELARAEYVQRCICTKTVAWWCVCGEGAGLPARAHRSRACCSLRDQ